MENIIKSKIQESIQLKQLLMNDTHLVHTIESIISLCTVAFKSNFKVLFCGNGGSAADAQHLAAEFSGRFYLDREPLYAEALHVNSSYVTAVANDYSFDDIYARMVKAAIKEGDILFGISTSGNSTNIIKAMKQARDNGGFTVGFTGKSGGALKEHCDFLINIPSTDTPRIQEAHILVGHIICEFVEKNLFGKK